MEREIFIFVCVKMDMKIKYLQLNKKKTLIGYKIGKYFEEMNVTLNF